MKRPLFREDLDDIGLTPTQIYSLLEKQSEKRERRYKYIVLLTTKEAEEISKKTKKVYTRASKWKEESKK